MTVQRSDHTSSARSSRWKDLASVARQRLGVEDGQHWRLDVAFPEDECRVRLGHAAQIPCRPRRIVLSLLRLEQSMGSVRGKRFMASINEGCLFKVVCVGPAATPS